MKARIKISCDIQLDNDADVSYLGSTATTAEEKEADAERLRAYYRGGWHMIAIHATAEIHLPYGHTWITVHISSPGVWGIESDSSKEYLKEIYAEETAILIGMLDSLKDYELVP